jgi:hemerythrin-like metal-binding protein
MPLMEWSAEYSVGIPQIDAQHQELFEHVNHLHKAMVEGRGRGEVGRLLTFLARYTFRHFQDEERFMRAAGHPWLKNHQMLHGQFARKVQGWVIAQRTGNSALSVEILQEMAKWLRHHVTTTDREAMAFAGRDRGSGKDQSQVA